MKDVEIVTKIDDGDLWDIQRFGPRFGMMIDDRAIRAIEKGVPLLQHKEVKKLKRKMSKWIPVTERLPKDEKTVLISIEKCSEPDFGRFKDGKWAWLADAHDDWWQELDSVTAWMPLPKPYKEGENK